MAESADDTQVDDVISRMRALLNELEAAQGKDVKDEDGDEDAKPFKGKNLKEAGREAYVRVRSHNRRLRGSSPDRPNSGEPDTDDRLK